MAVRESGDPLLLRYQDALVLGAIREDVWIIGGKIWEHASFSHFWGDRVGGGFIPLIYPGAPWKAQRYFEKAVRFGKAGQTAKAMVQLGRASHLLIDMACPVHARRVPHWTDGYEWYIDGNTELLWDLRPSPPPPEKTVYDITLGMARFTRQFEPDRSNHLWGWFLKRVGVRRSLSRAEFAMQAQKILPEATARLLAVYQCFLRETYLPQSIADQGGDRIEPKDEEPRPRQKYLY
jgi:hypothetical protein